MPSHHLRILSSTLLAAAACAADPAAPAADQAGQLASLRADYQRLAARLAALEQPRPSAAGGVGLRLVDLSLDILAVAGASSATDDEVRRLQGGGHDPKRNGFTFQGAELSFAGAVDPFFVAEAHLVAVREEPSGETGIELEEAFARTTSLPYGLELKAGHYLLEFGRFNPTHAHAWKFIDQPVIIGRVFGGDGQRSPGARLLWSLPTPWLSELSAGIASADGENSASFLGEGHSHGGEEEEHDHEHGETTIGGRAVADRGDPKTGPLITHVRWANSVDASDQMAKLGLSAARGPNRTGDRTLIWGVDLAWKWTSAQGRGWPWVLVEGEFIQRRFGAKGQELEGNDEQPETGRAILRDQGVVLQAVAGIGHGWSFGGRFEHAWGSGGNIVHEEHEHEHEEGEEEEAEHEHHERMAVGGRGDDPERDRRSRYSALIGFQPSEFSRIRLQYNYDRAEHMDKPAHSVWLGLEVLIGAHPAHLF